MVIVFSSPESSCSSICRKVLIKAQEVPYFNSFGGHRGKQSSLSNVLRKQPGNAKADAGCVLTPAELTQSVPGGSLPSASTCCQNNLPFTGNEWGGRVDKKHYLPSSFSGKKKKGAELHTQVFLLENKPSRVKWNTNLTCKIKKKLTSEIKSSDSEEMQMYKDTWRLAFSQIEIWNIKRTNSQLIHLQKQNLLHNNNK